MARKVSLEDLQDLLTERSTEFDIDYSPLSMFNYVAQDYDGELCLFEGEPDCNGNIWDSPEGEAGLLSLGYFDVEEWPEGMACDLRIAELPIITTLENE